MGRSATLRSLRARLALVLIATLAVALGTVALLAGASTVREFDRFVERRVQEDIARLEEQLAALHQSPVQPAADQDGLVRVEPPPPPPPPLPPAPPPPDGDAVGFRQSVARSLAVAVLTGGTTAFVLAFMLTRRTLRSISDLTVAAQRLAQRDLGQRVRVQSNDEIGRLGQAFNAMADGLDEAERLRLTMVSDIAHELRTPLTNLRGYLEAVRDGVEEPTPDVIASLHEEALLLGRLVDDLQALSLAEAGRLRLHCRPLELAGVAERAVRPAGPRAASGGIAVRLDVPPDLPLVEADPERVGQVLRNLLDNALRHTPPGGAILVHARATSAEAVVAVRDTGAGITPEHLPFIFERFYRTDRSRSRATGGVGLGLAIVKQLIEAQGGRVAATSEFGRGTTITFTLPLAGASPAAGRTRGLPQDWVRPL